MIRQLGPNTLFRSFSSAETQWIHLLQILGQLVDRTRSDFEKHFTIKNCDKERKPLSLNEYTITDAFNFADEIRTHTMNEDDILVSYDVTALFTNVPLDETIKILVNKAFTGDWFNKTYGLNLQQDQLARLLEIATTNQLFQFNGQLYQQTDGVAMGSPLGPLMANVFMCHLEEKLTREGLMPQLYKRYVDDTLARMPSVDVAAEFLSTLITMELPADNKIPFIGIH